MNIPGRVLHPQASAQLDAFVQTPSHAVLLSGPPGGGKIRVAQALAAQLLEVGAELLASQPYYREVLPTNDSISIEQVRELIRFFQLKVPGKGRVKRVTLLQDADSMGTEAQNALLKLLEEPPADSVLILTSSLPERLLPTVLSRLQMVMLPAPDAQMLSEHFVAAGHPEQAVTAALKRAGTNIAEAEQLLQAGADAPDNDLDLVKKVLGGTAYDRLLLVDSLAKQKEPLRGFVDTLATVAMASLEAAAGKGAASVSRWRDVLQAASTAQAALERSGNAKLALTELMLAL
ncbi:MAG TPA: AAA family ATPase [Candidatus Saccharimonadales bacterium]|nr:AAA family ATPase [Candidatus Saccharimonadales bacterium]